MSPEITVFIGYYAAIFSVLGFILKDAILLVVYFLFFTGFLGIICGQLSFRMALFVSFKPAI